MNRNWIAALTAGLVVSFAACGNPDNNRAPENRASDAYPSVTLTGCLQPGAGPNEFSLTNVRPKDDARDAAGLTATSYTVIAANTNVDLAKQLNHQVEIKARAETSATSIPPTTQRDQRADQPRVDVATTPRLIVNDIKSTNDKCTSPSAQ